VNPPPYKATTITSVRKLAAQGFSERLAELLDGGENLNSVSYLLADVHHGNDAMRREWHGVVRRQFDGKSTVPSTNQH
jgi:hypothetical protein